LLLNARHVPYGLALPDVFGSGWRKWLGLHVMNDESVAFCLAAGDPPRRRAAYWVCGIGVLIGWPAGALLGAELGSIVRNPDVLGLDAMFPAAAHTGSGSPAPRCDPASRSSPAHGGCWKPRRSSCSPR
jgi:predicted branched-subunit amino acid permease